ncbi:uncharacterized protein Dwil_GK11526 [Drosophila willistoni]|uniref:Dynein regulatory complex protein 10 n=1 Tax=Drosophila willistoni TaxID=7260 RepID=B4N911_DROWI|nr:uncharacterized protein Dwil_GK11526 [Drosophila willistoni]
MKLKLLPYITLDFSNVRTTQIGCVLGALAEAINRVKISLILPRLLEDPDKLAKVLTGTKYERAITLVEDFFRRWEFIVREERPPLMDHGCIQIIDYFQKNSEMYLLFPRFMNNLKPDEKKLLAAFEMLYELAKERLHRTSKEAIAQERKLHGMYLENEVVKKSVAELKKKIFVQKVQLRWKMAAKEAYLQKCESDLANKRRQNSEQMQYEIEKCTRALRANQKASLERQAELEEQLNKLKLEDQKINKENLIQEKEARDEKNKLLLQLQDLIKKYDHGIRDKMVENMELNEEFSKAKKALDDFMVGFRKVEQVYKDIVVKREDAERRAHQQRVIMFMMNRAARKIQKYWKKWRRDLRKKNKRLRKQK